MLPNLFIHEAFGKFLLGGFDLLCGYIIYQILQKDLLGLKLTAKQILTYTSLWLFNPIVINISTRGNSESIVALCVLLTLYFFLQRKLVLSAILFAASSLPITALKSRCFLLISNGLAVHVKIYPVLFALPFVLYLSPEWVEAPLYPPKRRPTHCPRSLTGLITWV
jgi:phosphatidylinositol glycan class M